MNALAELGYLLFFGTFAVLWFVGALWGVLWLWGLRDARKDEYAYRLRKRLGY